MRTRDALYYIMTGKLVDGKQATEMGPVNEAVPRDQLCQHTRELADVLKGPKTAIRECGS